MDSTAAVFPVLLQPTHNTATDNALRLQFQEQTIIIIIIIIIIAAVTLRQNVTVLKHHAVTTYVGTNTGNFNLAVERPIYVISFTPRRLCPERSNSWYTTGLGVGRITEPVWRHFLTYSKVNSKSFRSRRNNVEIPAPISV